MPIVTQCPKCGQRLKAPDDRIGKQAKCPKCKNGFTIAPVADSAPAGAKASASSAAVASAPLAHATSTQKAAAPAAPTPKASAPKSSSPAADQSMWHVQTADGAHYGPVTKADLDAWVADERLDAECQVLMDGWDQWKWAEEVYPQLAAAPQAEGSFDATATAPGGVPIVADDHNPYASPVSRESGHSPAGSGGVESQRIVRAMQQTRPWVLLFAVLAFIATGLVGLYMLLSMVTMLKAPLAGMMSLLIFGIYGAIYGYMGMLLLKYSSACDKFSRSKKLGDLELALEAQRNFWKFAGILALIGIGLGLLAFLITMFVVGGLAFFAAQR